MTYKAYKALDNSCNYIVTEEGLKPGSLVNKHYNTLEIRKLKLLADNLVLPAENVIPTLKKRTNDCIVMDIETKEIFFTKKIYLRIIEVCPNCGTIL